MSSGLFLEIGRRTEGFHRDRGSRTSSATRGRWSDEVGRQLIAGNRAPSNLDSPRAGRRGLDEIRTDIGRALRVVDDPDALSQLRLARDPHVLALAERRYGRLTRLSRGCALRDLLKAHLKQVADNSRGPFADFARGYSEQAPIARIARQLGMSRAHLSRVYRPRLVAMVSDEFVAEARRDGSPSTTGTRADKSSALRMAR
jgi:hypothetical protein